MERKVCTIEDNWDVWYGVYAVPGLSPRKRSKICGMPEKFIAADFPNQKHTSRSAGIRRVSPHAAPYLHDE